MAEFLVHQQVPLSAMTGIGVSNEAACAELQSLLAGSALQALIAVRRDWYY
jgi:ssDNA thymidine ADP-ribosyltransferase, DarT